MPAKAEMANELSAPWVAVPDPKDRFSTGIADFDLLLGGGLPRGAMALFAMDSTVGPRDRELLLSPILLNFLGQSQGVIAVLPARESPHGFRAQLTKSVSRRLFDSRVRVIDYVGEEEEAVPYVVRLEGGRRPPRDPKKLESIRKSDMEKMVAAERAVRGARGRMFLELIAFEIMELTVGAETASRMFFHGIKRTRSVGNLCVGILRPGLGCADAVRAMADVEFDVHRNELGLILRGVRPAFPAHLVVTDPKRGAPYVSFLPAP